MDKVAVIVLLLAAVVPFGDAIDCFHCNSLEDKNCGEYFQSSIKPQKCSATPNPICYTAMTKDGYVERGCMENGNETKCDLEHFKENCFSCNTSGCNGKRDAIECFQCNSLEDKNCREDFQSSIIKAQKCSEAANPICYTARSIDGYVERGCMENRNETKCDLEHFKGNCFSCNTSGCNGKLKNPIYCFNCTSETDPTCYRDFRENIKCDYFENCMLYVRNEKVLIPTTTGSPKLLPWKEMRDRRLPHEVIRSCASPRNTLCGDLHKADRKYCEECNTSRCNDKVVEPTPQIDCYNCTSTEDRECGYDFNATIINTIMCGDVYEDPVCVTATMNGSHVVKRFCSSAQLHPCADDSLDSCEMCSDMLCNAPTNNNALKCYCQALNDTHCKDQVDGDGGSLQCGSVFDNPACYLAVENGYTLRGCTSKVSDICTKKAYSMCNPCYTENCNSAASGLQWSLSVALGAVIVFTLSL